VSDLLHFEDFHEGQSFPIGPYEMTRAAIIDFAQKFDPQPFHLDEEAAEKSLLGKLSASGWHTCSAMIRMATDAVINRSAAQGSSGIEDIKWLKPVFVNDILSGALTISAKRFSKSRQGFGILNFTMDAHDQAGEKKCEIRGMVWMKTRG
jgi:acyl dehydratase